MRLVILATVLTLVLSACSANAPTIAPVSEEPTAAALSPTDLPTPTVGIPTATFEPTLSAEPTATAEPAATEEPTAVPALALAEDGFDAWCVPQTVDVAVSRAAEVWVKPADARGIEGEADQLRLLAPSWTCVLAFTFNQNAPQGLKLQIFEPKNRPDTAWFDHSLSIAESQPNLAYIVLKHTYIVNPPLWQVPFNFRLSGQDGSEYWSQLINIKRDWDPRVCWNGKLQNPVTLFCDVPSWGDRHPTDWGYNLPMPTPGGEPGSGSYMPGQ